MFRALRPAMKAPGRSELASLFLYSAAAIPIFYLPALFYGPHTNFAVIDNWRFWIIHLWVEGFFELFATVLVATMFHQMGLVSVTTATRVVYLDAILYLGAGIIGTGHHWYFTGQGTLNMGLASAFSAMEVVPLTLLTLDAWDFVRIKDRPCAECGGSFAGGQIWAIYFLMAVGFWNFVGAGVFGFLINLPIVSYFEMGTLLTSNHGHAAMFGVFGMLALARPGVLPARHADGRGLGGHREARARGVLGAQHRARAHGGDRPVSRRRPAAVGLAEQRVLARAPSNLPDERNVPHPGVGPDLRGHGLPDRRRRADPDRSDSIVAEARCPAGLRG